MSAVGTVGTGSSTSDSTSLSANNSLSANDFIQMMITELQNQDPLDPTSSDQLLSEMSQIGQLQASDSMQTTMGNMSLQTQIGSSASLIGKTISGLDTSANNVTGVVNSVQVSGGSVTLALDNGSDIALTNVTNIGAVSTSTTSGSTGTSGTGTSGAGTSGTANAADASANAASGVDASNYYSGDSGTYTGM